MDSSSMLSSNARAPSASESARLGRWQRHSGNIRGRRGACAALLATSSLLSSSSVAVAAFWAGVPCLVPSVERVKLSCPFRWRKERETERPSPQASLYRSTALFISIMKVPSLRCIRLGGRELFVTRRAETELLLRLFKEVAENKTE